MSEGKVEDKQFFTKVATLENEFEADVIKDSIEKEQIPTMIRRFQDTDNCAIWKSYQCTA